MLWLRSFILCQQVGGVFTQFWKTLILFTFLRFPLYPKGGEKLQFDYGVYLLNKNIAQVSNSSLPLLLLHTLQPLSLDCSPSF